MIYNSVVIVAFGRPLCWFQSVIDKDRQKVVYFTEKIREFKRLDYM